MTRAAKNSKPAHSLWLEILLFILIFIVIAIPQSIISSIAQLFYLFTDKVTMSTLINASVSYQEKMQVITEAVEQMPSTVLLLTLFSDIILIGGIIFYCTKIERRNLYSMGFSKKNFAGEYFVGLGIGFAMFSVAVLICLLTKTLTFDSLKPDIPIFMIIMFFLGFIVQGAGEEVLCRSYFLISVTRNKSFVVAILANSLLFSALHLLNSGISPLALLNITLFGIFASVYVLKRGNIWGACAIHSMWNFVQGNFYGIKVSGINLDDSILTSSLSSTGTLVNGGEFGLEGGLAVTFVLIVSIVGIMMTKTKKSEIYIPQPIVETPYFTTL